MSLALHTNTAAPLAVAVAGPNGRGVSLLGFAEQMKAAVGIAQQTAMTSFVPDSLKVLPKDGERWTEEQQRTGWERTVANIAAALMTGAELGLEPMAALSSMDIIKGTPALRAKTQLALVQARGHLVYVVESTETRCIVAASRYAREPEQRSTWTLDKAKALGLLGKPNWRTQPGTMLRARATAEACRMVAADALLALPYSVEELDDGDDRAAGGTAGEVVAGGGSAPPPPRRTAKRAPLPAADTPEPDRPYDQVVLGAPPAVAAEPSVTDEPPPPERPAKITDPQQKAIHAGLRDIGIYNRNRKLEWITELIDEPVLSTDDLTHEQASVVLDRIAALRSVGATVVHDDDQPARPVEDRDLEPPLFDEPPDDEDR